MASATNATNMYGVIKDWSVYQNYYQSMHGYAANGDMTGLENAKSQKIRIIHYGDSQIEGDRMSNYLRTVLQKKFGGYGVGLIPAIQTIPSASIGQKCTKNLL